MTVVCPFCDYTNIQGEEACEQCGLPLDDHLPTPVTAIEKALLRDRLSALSPRRPITVTPDTSIRSVLQLMSQNAIGCVMVVEGEKIVGIFSERDVLVRLNTQAAELGDCPVSQFMTPDPQALKVTAKVAFAVHRMDLGGYRHVPIVDEEGRPMGVVSVRDILRYLSQHVAAAAR